MKYGANAYFNGRVLAMLDGYTPGDSLHISVMVIFPTADSPEKAADQVWSIMNADERPNGRTERSLSLGDVVKIIVPPVSEDAEGEIVWLAAEHVGWKRIEDPTAEIQVA